MWNIVSVPWSIDRAKFKNICYTVFSYPYPFNNFKLLSWEGVLIKWRGGRTGLDLIQVGVNKWKMEVGGEILEKLQSSSHPPRITLLRAGDVGKIFQASLKGFDH